MRGNRSEEGDAGPTCADPNQNGPTGSGAVSTPEQDEAERKFGRIFQADHTSLRLAQRDLQEIDREAARPRLLEIVGDRAVLYFRRTNTFVPIIRWKKGTTRADDWLATTAYRVNDEQEARRKAARDNSYLIVLEGSTSDEE